MESVWSPSWNGTGVGGRLFGLTPYQVFLPAAGLIESSELHRIGELGLYWTGTPSGSTQAYVMEFNDQDSDVGGIGVAGRGSFGFSIRCVAE